MRSSRAADTPTVRACRREWAGLAVLALPTLLVSMDFTLLHLALPQVSADLRPTGSQLLWITDIYGFLLAGFLIPMGSLGDRIGLRRMLMTGAVIFGAASVLAAFAPNSLGLIATRGLLGVAGATLVPSALSLIRHMFLDESQRRVAISLWMVTFMVGSAAGPLVGGVLLHYFWWGSVFLIGVPAMLLFLSLGRIVLPEYADRERQSADKISVVLALSAILAFIYGVKQLAQHGIETVPAVTSVIGIGIGILFLSRQRKLPNPLVDLPVFKNRVYSLAFTVQLLSVFTFMGTFFFIAQFLQLVIGLSALQAGLWILPGTLAGIVGVLITPFLARAQTSHVIACGLMVAAGGFGVLTRVEPESGPALVLAGLSLVYAGLSPPSVLITDVILSSVPRERAGMAAAMSETSHELGGALGIALLGSIGAVVYRHGIATVPGLGSTDRGTLTEALAASARLSGSAGARGREDVLEAFSTALQVTTGLSAAIVAALAVAALLLLPRERRTLRRH